MFKWGEVCIRPVERADLVKLFELRSDPRVRLKLGSIRMVSMEDQMKWFERMSNAPSSRYYVYFSDEIDFIGIVRMDEADWINRSIRVGGDILSEFQGRGYGSQMFELIKKYCFHYLGMHRIWLFVLATNDIARRLYQRAGFSEEGCQREAIYRDGRFLDYVMMSMLSASFPNKSGGL